MFGIILDTLLTHNVFALWILDSGSLGIIYIICDQVLRHPSDHRTSSIVTGGVRRRWYGCSRTELEVRIEEQRSEYVSKSYYCLLYKRTSKERRKGNPPTPSTLSLYTIRLPPLEPFFMLRCTIRILSHDLTHHSSIPYHNNHAISSDVATLLTTSLSY